MPRINILTVTKRQESMKIYFKTKKGEKLA